MSLDALHSGLAALSGMLVGFTLGLVGGGGSILAVPLMVYLVGVKNPHVAIGTSAFAVAANAAVGMINHARHGSIKWRIALVYAVAGVAGAFAGSTVGKAFNGEKLLFLFALLMVVVGVAMVWRRGHKGRPEARLTRQNAPKVLSAGLGTGLVSGFFGIGGGFLIVPGLVASTGMPIFNAIGSSLVAVTAFGLTTAVNYAVSGLVDWPLAGIFILGGVAGSLLGAGVAKRLSARHDVLTSIFATLIFLVAFYMIWRSAGAWLQT
jgi:uncharacterized membrane protein YfcA